MKKNCEFFYSPCTNLDDEVDDYDGDDADTDDDAYDD